MLFIVHVQNLHLFQISRQIMTRYIKKFYSSLKIQWRWDICFQLSWDSLWETNIYAENIWRKCCCISERCPGTLGSWGVDLGEKIIGEWWIYVCEMFFCPSGTLSIFAIGQETKVLGRELHSRIKEVSKTFRNLIELWRQKLEFGIARTWGIMTQT